MKGTRINRSNINPRTEEVLNNSLVTFRNARYANGTTLLAFHTLHALRNHFFGAATPVTHSLKSFLITTPTAAAKSSLCHVASEFIKWKPAGGGLQDLGAYPPLLYVITTKLGYQS